MGSSRSQTAVSANKKSKEYDETAFSSKDREAYENFQPKDIRTLKMNLHGLS